MNKKVCLLGTSNTLKEAPFKDKSFEFWALNDMYAMIPKENITRWFEMHKREFIDVYHARISGKSHIEELRNLKIPIYMQEEHEDIPTSIKYPLEEMIKHFKRDYFQSTLDYMMAFALYEGFEKIHIYGVNMAINEEYVYQRASMSYWIGRAESMGVNVVLPKGCDLLKQYFRYGYEAEKESDLLIKARAKSAELDLQSKEFMKNYYLSLGAKDTWDFILRELR
jgi:hypothetical protein